MYGFRLTINQYLGRNHSYACSNEFGPGYRTADWTFDMKHVPLQSLGLLCDSLYMPFSPSPTNDWFRYFVENEGLEGPNAYRFYNFNRLKDDQLPSGFLVHDSIVTDSTHLYLGSWFDLSGQVLCIREAMSKAGEGLCRDVGEHVQETCDHSVVGGGQDSVQRDVSCGWGSSVEQSCAGEQDCDSRWVEQSCAHEQECKAQCTWDDRCRGFAVTPVERCNIKTQARCLRYLGCSNVTAFGSGLNDTAAYLHDSAPTTCFAKLEPRPCKTTPSVDYSTPSVDNSTPSVSNSTPSVDYSTPSVDYSTPSVDDSTSIDMGVAILAGLIVPMLLAVACCLLRRKYLGQHRSKAVFATSWRPRQKIRDPAWAAISMEQLWDLREEASQHFGPRSGEVNMHDVVAAIVRPRCSEHDKCYAHILNDKNLLQVVVFVSHCWTENFDMFCESIFETFRHWTMKPNLWICATALYQTTDQSKIALQVGTGSDPRKAPFSRALMEAEKVLIVRNDKVDLYSRIWCCWELFCAYELGFLERPGVLMVAGPAPSTTPLGGEEPAVDISDAEASNPEDKRTILETVMSSDLDVKDINRKLTEVKYFDCGGPGEPRGSVVSLVIDRKKDTSEIEEEEEEARGDGLGGLGRRMSL